MNSLEREYIAIGFNDNTEKIIPVIRMSGSDGLKKVIQGVRGVESIGIFRIDFNNQKIVNIGNVKWPNPSLVSDVMIKYEPAELCGTVCIMELDQKWSYSVNDGDETSQQVTSGNTEVSNQHEESNFSTKKAVIDKDRVRQLEAEKQIKILWPDELAEELKKDVFGQDEAIKTISEIVAANLRRKKPEVEVIVLFGPTGVGKTETGKALPEALKKLTGQEYGFSQIAMNQYTEAHSLHQFFGSPPSYVGYKDPTIFEPCRKNGYYIFLLDEIEKSTELIWTGLMECFSNSSVKLADNTPEIDLSHAIFILTSNVPIDMDAYNVASPFQKKEICRDALTKYCCPGHPEVAGKIGNCLAFQELPGDAVTDIILKFVEQELEDHDMELEYMDEYLMVQLKEMHKNSKYGARSVKDAVRTALTFTAYDRDIDKYKGKEVRLSCNAEDIKITVNS